MIKDETKINAQSDMLRELSCIGMFELSVDANLHLKS
jgi:hypothetical protein